MEKSRSFILTYLSLIVFIAVLTIFTTQAFAGNRPGALTITPAWGYEFFSSKRRIDNTQVGALMVAYNLTSHWGIEGYLGIFNTHFDSSQNDTRGINGTLFAVDGVYHFLPERLIEPYLLAGVGITGTNPSRRTDANNDGNINGAVGVQFFVRPSLALRMEARDLYTILGGKNDVILHVGVSVLFDFC